MTKYPLLLGRLLKVTPSSRTRDRQAIRHARERIEAALEQMNKVSHHKFKEGRKCASVRCLFLKDAKDVSNGSRVLWRRLPMMSSSAGGSSAGASSSAAGQGGSASAGASPTRKMGAGGEGSGDAKQEEWDKEKLQKVSKVSYASHNRSHAS